MVEYSGILALAAPKVDVNPFLRWFVHHRRIFESTVLQDMVIETKILCELEIFTGRKANNLFHGTVVIRSDSSLVDEVCQAKSRLS